VEQSAVAQVLLMLEQQVVYRPELALERDGLSRLGSVLRVGVDLRQRHVPEHESQLRRKLPLKLAHDPERLTAIRAFEVPILDQRDHGVIRPTDVIVGADRDNEAGVEQRRSVRQPRVHRSGILREQRIAHVMQPQLRGPHGPVPNHCLIVGEPLRAAMRVERRLVAHSCTTTKRPGSSTTSANA
jgi:hypothetical protein